MTRSIPSQLFILFIFISLALSPLGVVPVFADHADPLPTTRDISGTVTPGQLELSFANMNMTSPQALPGPVSAYSLRFNLPPEWAPTGKVELDLDLSAFFSSLVPVENNSPISGFVGGNLSVSLNGSNLGVKTLQQSGDQTIQFDFDSALLTMPSRQSYNEIRIHWDGSASCLTNLSTSVTILPTSKIIFSYTENSNSLTLNNFPVPFIIENSIQPVPLILLLPNSPAISELRAALIVAAGIGQLSGNISPPKLETVAQYNALSSGKQNLILIATNEKLGNAELQAFGLSSQNKAGPGEGIIHLFQSSNSGNGLLVSGDETGIIKAAQVLSGNLIVASGDAATMIVSAVNPPTPFGGNTDMTLQNLGVGEMLLAPQAGLAGSFDFFIPAGEQARPDSYFDLTFSHSQLLDYLRSGLQIKLNGFPAASLRLNDNTANQTLFRLILPSNLIRTGRNTVQFIAMLNTKDICDETNDTVAWLRISASSLLHLPLERAVNGSVVAKVFKDFPDSFLSGSGLDNVTFVLPQTEIGSWQAAVMLAYQLGNSLPQSELLQLGVTWSDAIDPAKLPGANLILVGKPLDFTILSDNDLFPSLVFSPDNTLSGASTLAIVTKPVSGTDVGYVAIRGDAGATDRIMMAVLGNTPAGISFAVDTVSSPKVSASNFAMVVAEGKQTSWLDQGISTGSVVRSPAAAIEAATETNAAAEYRQGILPWVLPVGAGLLVVLIMLIYIELRQRSVRSQ